MPIADDQIRTRQNPDCHVCGAKGELLYQQLQDRLFGALGEWDLKKCPNPQCGLVWLDPMPIEEDIGKAYRIYYTHQDNSLPPSTLLRRAYRRVKAGYLAGKYGYQIENTSKLIQLLGWILYLHPGRRASLDASVFYLTAQHGGRLLEVGCGSGVTLKGMQVLGWDVEGVDFDINSVRNARSKGLTVRHGDLVGQQYQNNTFDVIVMSHVIEHVPDPLRLLHECYRILKQGGQLVVLTPNVNSIGHRIYGANWRGLEPPRHLHLFNVSSLTNLALRSKFNDVSCQTSVRSWKIFIESHICSREGKVDISKNYSVIMKIWAEVMELLVGGIKVFFLNVGEELKLVGKKNGRD